MNSYFINEAIDISIKSYLDHKLTPDSLEFNSFNVIIIRMLSLIYGELDITSPYIGHNEDLFASNLKKYELNENNYNNFINNMQAYYVEDKSGKIPNSMYIPVINLVIDMFTLKKNNFKVTMEETEHFKFLIKSLNSPFETQILNYFDTGIHKNIISANIVKPKKMLAPEAYTVINKNYTDIALLSAEDIEKINSEVYKVLEVNEKEPNFEYLFEKALIDFWNKRAPLTSGNGYVDILLILGIICTIILLVIIGTIIFL